MNVNTNHPSFIQFLDQTTNSILSNVTVSNYFSLSPVKKMALQYIVLKLLKNTVKVRAILTDEDFKFFITVLRKKNDDIENFEFSAILFDMSKNVDVLIEKTKTKKKTNKIIKIENKE
jgi:hypothetical protein